jgi:A/G-specific adenine glycosylase
LTAAKITYRLPVPINEFALAILNWFSIKRRNLPWRCSTDPYRIWVSEVMLQQTQVKTVIPYYERFLRLYPTLEALARAEVEEVLDVWAGLGYYSRARNLHRAVQMVVRDHQGKFPVEYQQALKLPGVGRYSAGAVLSIAHGLPYPVLDGNVSRVLARYLKIEEPIKGPVVEALWTMLGKMVRDPFVAARVSEFNQGLMELGALVCAPVKPDCLNCPLSDDCGAFLGQAQDKLPVKARRRRVVNLSFVSALVRKGPKYLMLKNDDGPFLKGFWEFPRVEGAGVNEVSLRGFREIHGLELVVKHQMRPVSHTITFRKLRFHPFEAGLVGNPSLESFAWIRPGEKGSPMSAYIRKIMEQVER